MNKLKKDKFPETYLEIRLIWRISLFHLTKEEYTYLLQGFDELHRDMITPYKFMFDVSVKMRKSIRDELFNLKCYNLCNMLVEARKHRVKYFLLDVDGSVHLDKFPAFIWDI